MRLAMLLQLTEKGVPNKGKDHLAVPGDCKRRILVRAANTAPLHTVPGGEHDRVVDDKGNTLTTIPHGEPTIGVCRDVVGVLNDPKRAASMPRFRGQAVK